MLRGTVKYESGFSHAELKALAVIFTSISAAAFAAVQLLGIGETYTLMTLPAAAVVSIAILGHAHTSARGNFDALAGGRLINGLALLALISLLVLMVL